MHGQPVRGKSGPQRMWKHHLFIATKEINILQHHRLELDLGNKRNFLSTIVDTLKEMLNTVPSVRLRWRRNCDYEATRSWHFHDLNLSKLARSLPMKSTMWKADNTMRLLIEWKEKGRSLTDTQTNPFPSHNVLAWSAWKSWLKFQVKKCAYREKWRVVTVVVILRL